MAYLPLLRSLLLEKELWPPGQVRTRRTLEYGALEALSMKPNTFSNGIRDLRIRGDVGFEKVSGIGSQWATHVYYQDFADAKQLRACKAVLIDREQLLRPHLLKAAGEIYTRALLKYIGLRSRLKISAVPQTRRLGYEMLNKARGAAAFENEKAADLTFIVSAGRKHIPCIVEVKNHREHLHSSKGRIVEKLIAQAIRRDYSLPIFMASHVTPEFARICRAIGVAVHSYGRQFIRSQDKAETKRLFPSQWKGQFQFVRLNRVFAIESYIDPRSQQDVRTIGDSMWFETAHKRWIKMRPRLPEIREALIQNDREMLRALVSNV